MCAVTMDPGVVRNFALDYLKQNPKATEADVQVAARSHFQGKISRKGLSQIAPTISEVCSAHAEQVRANFQPVETPVVKQAAKRFNTNQAYRYYQELDRMSEGARARRKGRSMQEAKAAFGTEEYLEVLKRNNPAEYEREVARLKEQNKPVQSNNAAKKEANAEYQSPKKKKADKKAAEATSQAEHKEVRMRNSKPAREARYLTRNGLMKTNERKLYEAIKSHEIIADAPWSWNNAEASARVFEEHGLTDLEKKLLKEEIATPIGTSGVTSTTSSRVTKAKVVEQASETAANAAETAASTGAKAAKEAAKSGGKWGWILGGAAAIAAAAGGYKMYSDKQQEQKLNLSA